MTQLFYVQSHNGQITHISDSPHDGWTPVFVNQSHTDIINHPNQYSIDKGNNVNYPNENKVDLHLPDIRQTIKSDLAGMTFGQLKPKDTKPMNLAPYFWIQTTHNDPHTFTVPVQQGKAYWLSGTIGQNNGGETPIRAFSPWNLVDKWGDITPNDNGVTNVGDTYKVGFIAPKTGDMPIYFNYTNVSKALEFGGIFAVRNITVTQSDNYIPYEDTNNDNQTIKDITGDNEGGDAISKFGSSVLKGYQGNPDFSKSSAKVDSSPINTTNIFPNYWVDSSHNDYYTFNVPVQKGHHYFLSAVVANDPSGVGIRASSSWNIADEWGDIVQDDEGTSGVGNLYEIDFTAPKTGNMPIEFMFTSVAKAMQNGGASLMLKHITMTDGNIYVPYMIANNDNQSVADVTGDAGMDGVAMFGASDLHGYQGNPIHKAKPIVINSNVNIFPNYWVDASHNDPYTFNVPVQKGHTYQLSATIANDPSNVPLRASSSWNVADQWGDVVPNDGGVAGVGNTYHISFVAPKTGNMPIEFIFTSVAKAIQRGNAGMMLKRITMTNSAKYIPYTQCDNSKQSVADVTGDAGMDGRAMFGNL